MMTLQQSFITWREQWQTLLDQLQQRGVDTAATFAPVADLQQVEQVEQQLDITLPTELRELLLTGASEVSVIWYVPSEQMVPFGLTGDVGWSLEALDFVEMWSEDAESPEQRRYLTFYHAGNGDRLVLDLSDVERPAVLSWDHETGEFRLLAGSLTAFLERITALYGIGAEHWQYEHFIDHGGLNIHHPQAQRWQQWMHDYVHLTLEQARTQLDVLIRYAEMHDSDDAALQQAFAAFSEQDVLTAWLNRIEQERDVHLRHSLMECAASICRSAAADWVRELWNAPSDQRINSAVLAYVTACCLPEQEGLQRVYAVLEQLQQSNRLNGYGANSWLKPFYSREVLQWMWQGKRVSYPYDGWDRLFACSAPEAEDIWQWLGGSTVQRQVVISALSTAEDVQAIFPEQDQLRHTLALLEGELDKAVTKKEKNLVNSAIQALSKQ
ncbi:SMI1/KNR4 family protein [Paenibacillus sp. WLX1005]|uniref:SMI1/KNR4 family protein n=1 Tax=Paenibacillus sp. WLX1005 TaxID=3243766 RepID=UPI0039842379